VRYGIEAKWVGGCCSANWRYDEGYNALMDHAIKGRFGADVFERTFAEAERLAEAGQPDL
jgi:hypothetical protein